MKKKLSVFIFFILICAADDIYSQYPCYRIHPSDNFQIEPIIVKHPTNPMIMFAGSFTIKPFTVFRSEGVYVTTNGGQTWFGSDTCTGAPINNHAGDPGPIIDKDGRFIMTHLGSSPPGMYSNYSTDLGANWSGHITIAAGDNDKGAPGTDDIPLSAYYGRTYLAWSRFNAPFAVAFSYTTSGGVSWSPLQQINNSISGHQCLGAGIAVSPAGVVYVTWASVRTVYPYIEDYLGFGISTNGGANWSVQETAVDINGIKAASLPPWGIKVNSYPGIDVDKTSGARNGWIYLVTTEINNSPAGSDPDIVLFRSTNGGVNWSAGIRVNQDPLNNGKIQYFPAIRVDEDGGVNVVYYDNRNISTDSVTVYISRSIDGGNTWSDYLISDHNFKPSSIFGTGANQGDNIGMTSGNGKLWPVWMDNFSGSYQIWTVPVDINTIGIKNISSNTPESFSLKQNYPNPFNPSTKIRFTVPAGGERHAFHVRLIIYDMIGKEISKLVNNQLAPGTYEAEWNAENIPSGVYFYKLTVRQAGSSTGEFSSTKKMVLMK